MRRARIDRLETVKRAGLLEHAAEEFAAKGYDGASLNRILDRSAMGKSSFYYYFDDKADLLAWVVESAVSTLFAHVGPFALETLTAETYWGDCEAYYARCIALAGRDERYVKLGSLFYQLRGDLGQSGSTEEMFATARAWVATFIARGQDLGVVRTDLPQSLLLDCLMGIGEALDRWVVANWHSMGDVTPERIASQHIDLVRRLLQP